MRHLCRQGKYLQSNTHSQLLGNTAVIQIKFWVKSSYSITRLIYTITHKNFSSSQLLKMGFQLLKENETNVLISALNHMELEAECSSLPLR